MSGTTTRVVTLFDDPEGAPSITAECTAEGWNGYHVPMLTAAALRGYWRECAANDPNGEWDVTTPFVADDGTLHIPSACEWDDRTQDAVYSPIHRGAYTTVYAVDGLVWVDGEVQA